MVFDTFYALVTVLALAYAGISRFIQNKLMDKVEMEAFQKESKDLTAEMDKAQKAKDKERIDELLKKQMDMLPRMNKMMMGQFKPMFIILAVFFLLTGVLGQLDPTVKDDIKINLTDDGKGCDKVAGDGIFSACYRLDPANTNYGKWTVLATVYEKEVALGHNETYFLYNPKPENIDRYVERAVGEDMTILTDKSEYMPNDTVMIYAIPANMTKGSDFLFIQLAAPRPLHADHIETTLSNGTYFRVDLPLTIPFVDINRIYQPYTWFIIISVIVNLSLSVVMAQYDKWKKAQKIESR